MKYVKTQDESWLVGHVRYPCTMKMQSLVEGEDQIGQKSTPKQRKDTIKDDTPKNNIHHETNS